MSSGFLNCDPTFVLPTLDTSGELSIPQPIQIKIWAEKTTVNDIILPLARSFGLNVVTASGETSAIACRQLVDRAERDRRPFRILYVSDFDPAGRSIPVAMARKVEYEIQRRSLACDIQVRPVVLTEAQCIEYKLPRAPIKDTERRATQFEERFGEGATELDALEALHPGELRRILLREIERYWNPDHAGIVRQAERDFADHLHKITNLVTDDYRDEIATIKTELEEFHAAARAFHDRVGDLFARMQFDLEQRAPAFPPPAIHFEPSEDADPLFDSRRSYLDQLDAYRRFQGKTNDADEEQVRC